jgi:prepilin-type N-terminal cleavage/methylation domain-containing protein
MKTMDSKKRQGFTLVEMMVAVTVGAFSIVLILSSYLAISTSLSASSHYRDMHHELRHAMDILRKDISRGSGVSQCTASNKLTMTTTVGVPPYTNTVSVVYNLAGNTLSRTEASGQPVTLAMGVDSVLFTLYDASGTGTANLADAYFVGVKMAMKRQGVRNTYKDALETRNRMRCKGL